MFYTWWHIEISKQNPFEKDILITNEKELNITMYASSKGTSDLNIIQYDKNNNIISENDITIDSNSEFSLLENKISIMNDATMVKILIE